MTSLALKVSNFGKLRPQTSKNSNFNNKLMNLMKKAATPSLIKKAIDAVWNDFDDNQNGILDVKEARAFVDLILRNMYGAGNYNLAKFSTWFKEFDKDNSGGIEKSEFAEFVGRVARTAMFGHQNTAGH